MLVVISDLHFVDATAGSQNLPVDTFKNVFLTDIVGLIREKGVSDVQVLLLGDTVDLLRTAQWLDVDAKDRPWGENGIADVGRVPPSNSPSKTEIHCLQVLGRMPEIGTERPVENEKSIL